MLATLLLSGPTAGLDGRVAHHIVHQPIDALWLGCNRAFAAAGQCGWERVLGPVRCARLTVRSLSNANMQVIGLLCVTSARE